MEATKIKGVVKHVGALEQISDKFTKQVIVIEETEGQYPKSVAIESVNKPVLTLQPGTNIEAYFNVESRESNGNWYTSARLWKFQTASNDF